MTVFLTMRNTILQELAQVSALNLKESIFNNAIHTADANLQHFFPQKNKSQRQELLAEVLFQQRMAQRDQSNLDLLPQTRVLDEAGVLNNPQQARIFCTYHVGSYRHAFHLFANSGIDCLLFISGVTLDKQGEAFLQAHTEGCKTRGWRGKLETVRAESRNSLLVALRALKRGMSVAIYIDGNAGMGKNKDNEHLCKVPFFGREIMARTGVAYLSHLSGVPIVPVTCKRDAEEKLSLKMHTPLYPDQQGPREAWVESCTAQLYSVLEQEFKDCPGQWEGWLYVHRYMRQQAAAATPAAQALPMQETHMQTDLERFALLHYGHQAVLLDKRRHSFTMLDAETCQLFYRLANQEMPFQPTLQTHQGLQHLLQIGALQAAA